MWWCACLYNSSKYDFRAHTHFLQQHISRQMTLEKAFHTFFGRVRLREEEKLRVTKCERCLQRNVHFLRPLTCFSSFCSIWAARLLQVTVFVYTDLMLVTREDEPGRCNVLQSPLFLRQLRLQDGTSPPAHIWSEELSKTLSGVGGLSTCRKNEGKERRIGSILTPRYFSVIFSVIGGYLEGGWPSSCCFVSLFHLGINNRLLQWKRGE